MTTVTVREENTNVQYQFTVDSDYEFLSISSVSINGSPISPVPADSQKMKSYWDNSFGKTFCDTFTESQQSAFFKKFPSLKIS